MDVIGGGVLVAVAAALWVAYLLPSWFRRRQYLATERNAVRLQQTLRILAETAETPEEVRVEATAREVAKQQRILRQREREAARTASDDALRALTPRERALRARRALRRGRAACTVALLAAVVAVVVGAILGLAGTGRLIALGGAAGFVVAFGGIVVLARRRQPVLPAVPVAPATTPFEPVELEVEATEPDHEWTPRPLPRPLTLSRGTIAAMALASVEAAAELKRVETDAELGRRAAELAPPMPELPARRPVGAPAASAPAASVVSVGSVAPVASGASAAVENPYARMGFVGEAEPGFDSLDRVLQRRRSAS